MKKKVAEAFDPVAVVADRNIAARRKDRAMAGDVQGSVWNAVATRPAGSAVAENREMDAQRQFAEHIRRNEAMARAESSAPETGVDPTYQRRSRRP